MEYPEELVPTCVENFTLPTGQVVSLPKCRPKFTSWRQAIPFDSYGGKAVLDCHGEPVFAELAILRLFERAGWTGVWVDTYRRKYRTAPKRTVSLPTEQSDILERISRIAGTRGGCFDVFVWNAHGILFAESKRAGRDRVLPSQHRWIDAALKSGILADSLLIVEWQLQDEQIA